MKPDPIVLATRRRPSSRMLARLGAVTLACSAFALSRPDAAGTVRGWDGGTGGGGFSWTGATNWNPDGVPVSGDALTLGASPNIPTSMTISAAVGAASITFANNFNGTNTTVIGSGSGSAQVLTLDAGWALTNNATGGSVTFQPLNGGTGALGVTLNGSGTVSVASGGSLVMGTQIGQGGTAGITKEGGGTLTLSGSNTYRGGTTTNAGTLLVNNASGMGTGTGSVTVNNGGTLLGGSGGISGAVTVNPGATLSPGGTGGNSVGALTTGSLTVNGIYQVNLTGTGMPSPGGTYDQTSVVGALTLGSASSLKLIAAANTGLAVNQVFYIALNDNPLGIGAVIDPVNGTFNGLAEGSLVADNLGDTYRISYFANGDGSVIGGNDIALTVTGIAAVPEPATVGAGLLALGALGWSQRRRLGRGWLRVARRRRRRCALPPAA